MPANPEPPHDSEEATSYAAGDAVYFLRHGQWRAGVVVGLGGSSDDSPRYMVRDPSKDNTYRIADCDMRKKT